MADLFAIVLPRLRRLLPPGGTVVVAVSGGPDSQALLDLLGRGAATLRLSLVACGIDHGLRAAAAAELHKAEQLATRHGIPFVAQTVQLAPSGNRLAAARTARFAALRALATRLGASRICLAQHADDQVETVLQRLCRGTGLCGLGAMRWRRGAVVRPLLAVRRSALQAYVAWRQLPFATDPSNTCPRRSRAQLRAQVLPCLQRLYPQFAAAVGELTGRLQQDERCLQQAAARLRRRAQTQGPHPELALPLAPLAAAPAALRGRALRQFLLPFADEAAVPRLLARLLGRQAATRRAWQLRLPGGCLRLERQILWWTPRRGTCAPGHGPPYPWEAGMAAAALPVGSCLQLRPLGLTLHVSEVRAALGQSQQFARRGRESVAFDADRLHFGLGMRPWRAGDTLQPFGLNGHVKVGDLFTNHKVPRALRAAWPVITHGAQIIWVVGLRRAAVAPVGKKTRRVVCLQADGGYASIEES